MSRDCVAIEGGRGCNRERQKGTLIRDHISHRVARSKRRGERGTFGTARIQAPRTHHVKTMVQTPEFRRRKAPFPAADNSKWSAIYTVSNVHEFAGTSIAGND
jgi:hypothetical protein